MTPDLRPVWILLALVAGMFLVSVFFTAISQPQDGLVDWEAAARRVADSWSAW